MRLSVVLLVLACVALYQCSVLSTLTDMLKSLDNRKTQLLADDKKQAAAREATLVVPFKALESAKGTMNSVIAANLKQGKIDREKYEKAYAAAVAQRDAMKKMIELNKGLSGYKQSSIIHQTLMAMLNGLQVNVNVLVNNHKKATEQRKKEDDLAKDNYKKAKENFVEAKRKADQQAASAASVLKRQLSSIAAEKKRVGVAATAIKTGQIGKRGKRALVRTVRVSNIRNYLQLTEVEVYDQNNKNVAKGKPARQSSTGWGGSASRAVDGNRNGNYWSLSTSHTRVPYGWWQVDLRKDVDVKKVVVYNRSDCCANRLGTALVTLLDKDGNILKHYKANGGRVNTFNVGKLCLCA